MTHGDENFRYSVAWVDCMTRGAHLGRSILTRGEHARSNDVESPSLLAPAPRGSRFLSTHRTPPQSLTIRAFTRPVRSHQIAARQPESISSFPSLDGVRDWNRLYGAADSSSTSSACPKVPATPCAEQSNTSHLRRRQFPRRTEALRPIESGAALVPDARWTLALDLPIGPASLPRLLDDSTRWSLGGGRIISRRRRLSRRR